VLGGQSWPRCQAEPLGGGDHRGVRGTQPDVDVTLDQVGRVMRSLCSTARARYPEGDVKDRRNRFGVRVEVLADQVVRCAYHEDGHN
jgi:hypothetical protein